MTDERNEVERGNLQIPLFPPLIKGDTGGLLQDFVLRNDIPFSAKICVQKTGGEDE